MLLRHALNLETEAAEIETAIGSALADGCRTADLPASDGAPTLSCTDMTQAILDRLP